MTGPIAWRERPDPRLARLGLAVLAPALLLCGGPALAQPAGEQAAVEELVVTGSRLPQWDLTANSPIALVEADEIERSGALTLEVLLNTLPQAAPSFSSAANNPSANGAAFVDLRGLGESRNLVLLDGRRLVGANASNTVDLNTLPTRLIERVEVITGGASAVYGADAVAGVVNVISRRGFQGWELEGRTLVSERGDGREHEAWLSFGHDFGRASLMGGVGWSERAEIGKGERAFSAQSGVPSGYLPGGGYLPGPNAPGAAAVNAVFAGYGVPPGAVNVRGGLGGFGFNTDGSLFATGLPGPPFDAQNYRGAPEETASAFFPDLYSFNFEPFNKLILPLERWSGALFGEVELTERVRLFGQALASRYTAATALAPSPAPTEPNPLYPGAGVVAFTIPVSNPFIPPDLARLLASRRGDTPALAGAGAGEEFLYRLRTVALGARESQNEAESLNLVAGLEARLTRGWSAEAYASFGRYEREEAQGGLLSVRRLEQLLDSPTGGTELCEGGFNPFGAQLGEACREFLTVRARYATRVEQENIVATVSGPLWRLPAGPVQAALGLEHRRVRFRFTPPADLEQGEVSGFLPLSALAGSVRFAEAFAELAAPILSDRPLAESLDLTLGYRRSHEAGTGGVDSWKAELSWSLAPPLRLRAAVQRAVRAPDIFERFEPTAPGFTQAVDPCAADNPARTSQVLALCRRQAVALGFPETFVDELIPFAELGVLNGGNPDLAPEAATTATAGAVWRPGWAGDWLSGLTLSVDGYSIAIDGAIAYRDPQLVLDACYNIGTETNPGYDPAHPACGLFRRSGVNFGVIDLQALQANQARLEVAGVDLDLAVSTDLAALSGRDRLGVLQTRLMVGWLARFEEQPSPRHRATDYAGTIGGQFPSYQALPRWKGRLDLTWRSGRFEVTALGRYIGPMEHRLDRQDPTDPATGVGEAWYWDLSARVGLGERAELGAGVLNLFDREPELYRPATDANTDPSTYDVVGRRFWLSLRLRL